MNSIPNWEKEIELPEKEADVEYAYILKLDPNPVVVDEETFFKELGDNDDIQLVTTPAHNGFIIPETDPGILKLVLKRREDKITQPSMMVFVSGLLAILFTCFFAFMIADSIFEGEGFDLSDFHRKSEYEGFTGLIFSLPFIIILNALFDLWTIRRINDTNYQEYVSQAKFDFWLTKRSIRFSFIPIILVFFPFLTSALQLPSILGLQHEDFWEIAGLVKPWVLEGGYWRILSAPFLHFSTPYLGIMVPVFGIAFPYIQKIAHPLYLPIVFLLSAVTGNLFSLLIFPNAAFMGPSGGILGIFGFLLTMSLKLESVPKNFTLLILKYIVLLLLAGLTAPLVLDVAVHLGGLLMGMYLGVVLVNDGEPDLPYKASPMVKFLGVVCTIVILGAIGFVALLFLADFVSLQLAL